jgi:arabinogalactan oligomer/maltooligosaccharide transport system permease protein
LISEAYRWAFARQAQYGYAAAYSAIIFVLLAAYAVGAQRLLAGREARA